MQFIIRFALAAIWVMVGAMLLINYAAREAYLLLSHFFVVVK